ncbi:DUF2243 domain-containing protein [Billgrantia montanilacus]|uniref:DUF2243 domain-containing protein n=1 Tax=Billgrantia montanilacus TaxID=2282305 RepID=A0A368TUS4_9GAMM|nr:DUF2243 domain-containing protein [Halomonas montanilacus]RCV88400.1 DUF2243 domain-containing protein [Halomonas montanilacus]
MATPPPVPLSDTRRSFWCAVLIGAGVMAGIDEILFHQILQWHHFFDHATPTVGILSDGLLHAAELLALVAGFFLLTDLARRQQLSVGWAWAGVFLGMGGFQLFDGIVSHKLLRIHQIRYDVDLLVYDLAWNLSALILLGIGLWLYRRASRPEHR